MSYRAHAYTELGCDRAPYLSAEELAPDIAHAAMIHFTRRTSADGKYRSAWYHVEFALHQTSELDEDIRTGYIDTAQMLLGEVIQKPTTPGPTRFGALVLSTYLPALHERAKGRPVTRDDCEGIYQSLGAAIGYIRPLPSDEPPPAIMVESVLLALSARTRQPEYLLYPASPREESSTIAAYNHDSYFLDRLRHKLPLQQKSCATGKLYDPSVTVIVLEPILDKAYKKYGFERPATLHEKINHILSLVLVDTQQNTLTRKEKAFLDFMGENIVSTYNAARSVNRQVAYGLSNAGSVA